jgi:hypothetical protein
MAQNEWFYENGGQRHGPVSPVALKALATKGNISPSTLVWKEGLPQWTPAKAIRGLFPEDTAVGVTPAPVDPPAATRIDPPAQPLLDVLRDLPHPLDLLIDRLRYVIPQDVTAKISRVAAIAGVYCIYLAIVMLTLGGFVFAAKVKLWWPLAAVLGAAAGLFVLQFVSHRLLQSLDAAISANKTVLSSFAVPDCAFVLIVAATIGSVGSIVWTTYSEITFSVLAGVLGVLAVGAFSAVVALQPQTIGVVISLQCRAAEEAVGVATFIMKLAIRCVPIFFAASVFVGTYKVTGMLLAVVRFKGLDAEFFADVFAVTWLLFCGAALPVVVYLLTLAYYLTLDVISAIVSIPAKLDHIAEVSGGGESSN